MKKLKWIRRIGIAVFAILIVVFLADLGYYTFVSIRIDDWERGIVRDEDGVQEGCRAYQSGSGDSAILFIHGINDSPYLWRRMLPQLANDDTECVAMRLPGFAESLDRYASYGRDDWIQAVAAQVDDLRRDHDRVFIVAHSLGCAITLAYLHDAQDRVDGIVLIAPAIEVSNTRSPILSAGAWHRIGSSFLLMSRTTMSPFSADSHDPQQRVDAHRTPFTPRRTIDETFALIKFNRNFASELKVPMMMVLAPEDAVVDSAAAKRFFEEASSNPRKLLEVNDSGHLIPVDLDWEAVTDEVRSFLQEVKSASQ